MKKFAFIGGILMVLIFIAVALRHPRPPGVAPAQPTNLVAKTFVNLPRCGLALLHAIPPVGSKFQEASKGGPQSQVNVANGSYSGSVSFYFGKL